MMKAKELRDKSCEELEVDVLETRKDLFKMRNEAKQAMSPEHPDKIRSMKKYIARLLTVIREKKVATN